MPRSKARNIVVCAGCNVNGNDSHRKLCHDGNVRVEGKLEIGKLVTTDPQMASTPESFGRSKSSQIKAKVVIADDHEIVREGIRRILTRLRPNWEICGEAANGRYTVELVKALKPDVVILDITMPGMSGLEAAREIAKSNLGCRILIFTVHDSDWLKTEIRDTGAHGYVQKSQVARDLVIAIERLLEGSTFFDDQTKTEIQVETNRLPKK